MTTSPKHSVQVAGRTDRSARTDESGQISGDKRREQSVNEAAHKLGDVAAPAASAHAQESEATRKRFEALADPNRDVIAHGEHGDCGAGCAQKHLRGPRNQSPVHRSGHLHLVQGHVAHCGGDRVQERIYHLLGT